MKHHIVPTLCAMAALGMISTSAYADRWTFVPHLEYPAYQEDYYELLDPQSRIELEVDLDDESLEPCAADSDPSSGLYSQACNISGEPPRPDIKIDPTLAKNV